MVTLTVSGETVDEVLERLGYESDDSSGDGGESMPDDSDDVKAEALFNGPVARAMRSWLVDHVVAKGADPEKAQYAVAQFGDGTLLKLIFENLPALIDAILRIIGALK